MATFEDFREYANLLPGEPDRTAQLCYDAAISHAHSVGIPDFLFGEVTIVEGEICDSADPKLNLYIYAIAAHWYDKRSFDTDGFVQAESLKMRRELMYREESAEDG